MKGKKLKKKSFLTILIANKVDTKPKSEEIDTTTAQ